MIRQTFAGRSILVVEDEPLVAMDIATEFEDRGAHVVQTHSLKAALKLIETDGLSAAILDHGLKDGDSTQLCERLNERRIPFVTYSGYGRIEGACAKGAVVEKPAPPSVLVATVEALLKHV
jgi:DNA-binding response OmpR family regulator